MKKLIVCLLDTHKYIKHGYKYQTSDSNSW